VTLREPQYLCELDPNAPRERIKDLLTMNGNLLISAYRKTGKTTLILALLHALTSGDDFIDRRCVPVEGTAVYVNLELQQNMLRKYALDNGMDLDNKNVLFMDYRGYGSEFRVCDDGWRDEFAAFLRDQHAKVLIIDPIHVLMIYNVQDSNATDEARHLMEDLGSLAVEAELDHLIVVDHTGHYDKSRARNSSGKEDWADVLWNVQGEEDQPRTLSAMGRGVQGIAMYNLNKDDRRLHEISTGTDDKVPAPSQVRVVLAQSPRAMTVKEIAAAAKLGESTVAKHLSSMEVMGNVQRKKAGRQGGAELWELPTGHI
jgi:hypothetical protein